MNANELADWIRDTESYDNPLPHINDTMDEVEAMLRQQQAEIKELKQQVAFLEDWRDTWSPTIKQLMNINVKVNDE